MQLKQYGKHSKLNSYGFTMPKIKLIVSRNKTNMNNQANDFEQTYLRGELVTLDNGKTYKARTAFEYKDNNYLIIDDGKYHFLSLLDLSSQEIVIESYISEKDLLIELSGKSKSEQSIIAKALGAGSEKIEKLKAYIKVNGDPRSFKQKVEVIDVIPLEVGRLAYVNVDAPYCQGDIISISDWSYKIDSNFRVRLIKYLIVKNKFNLYALFRITGKKSKELILLIQGGLSAEFYNLQQETKALLLVELTERLIKLSVKSAPACKLLLDVLGDSNSVGRPRGKKSLSSEHLDNIEARELAELSEDIKRISG